MNQPNNTIVVVGASLAGLRAAEELRRLDFDGDVVVVGAEPHLPYDRPPLSKALLADSVELPELGLRRQGYDDLDVEWVLGHRAVNLDIDAHRLTLDDGRVLDYRGCILAVGATPRMIPNPTGLEGIHALRTLDDGLALRADLERKPKVVVVGAGFIGAEVASSCRGRHLEVTMLEALPAPMMRGLGPVLGDVLARLHRDHGVDLRTGVGVAGFEGSGRVERVVLDDGSEIEADVVLVGIGVVPETDWLADSGLTIENGILCDETLIAAPDVAAVGDVCRWPNGMFGGELMRLEHWTNAAEQGIAAAKRLVTGEPTPFTTIPYVWSDQYDIKIQVLGSVRGDDRIEVVDGSFEDGKFLALAGRAGKVVGAVGFNRPRPLMMSRGAIIAGAPFDESVAAQQASA